MKPSLPLTILAIALAAVGAGAAAGVILTALHNPEAVALSAVLCAVEMGAFAVSIYIMERARWK